MLKIVDVHPSSNPQGEYVVLQNLGLVTVSLRGCALCTDAYLDGCLKTVGSAMYIFQEDIPIKPYTRVVVFTGDGDNGWVPTTDGKQAYCVCWGRPESVWQSAKNVHILQIAASRRIVPPGTAAAPCTASAVNSASSSSSEPSWPQSQAIVSIGETVG